jgi:quercetin dioxygenase-like cupin family protein
MAANSAKEPAGQKAGNAPEARALDLADLVKYADGAIVSRTIADGDGGSVTLFAFDAGQGLSEHSAPFDALVHVLEGQAEVTIAGSKTLARAGQLVVMPASVPHALRAMGRFKMLLTMLRSRS